MSQLLRTIRAARSLTQEDVSNLSGIPISTISRIETGRYNPTDDEVERIQVALGVRFRDIEPDFERFMRSISALN